MATKKNRLGEQRGQDAPVNLAEMLSVKTSYTGFKLWIVGMTPLITHAWSEKARREMLGKQVGSTKPGKAPRDPEADFKSSLYALGDGAYGFPAMGIKNALWTVAHKDKGIAKTEVLAALWINADIVNVRPALAGAVCNMPLVRIYAPPPQMREDPTKIGSGQKRTATLAYRGQFAPWAIKVTGAINTAILPLESMAFLFSEAGMACGLGEWRNERKGMFGAFRMANSAEQSEWEAYAAGKGKMPKPTEGLFEVSELAKAA